MSPFNFFTLKFIYFLTFSQQRMNEPLHESTSLNIIKQQDNLKTKLKAPIQLPQIQQYLSTSLPTIDFGDCVCGSVQEKKLAIVMLSNHQSPRIIFLRITFEDQSLAELPQYIFGVRKENSFEYFDQYKFKAMQKGIYNFIVGVKTPFMSNYVVKGKLEIILQGTRNSIKILLSQVPRIPQIKCTRQLVNEDGLRLIKLGVVKNKSRKQIKVAFKSTQNLSLNLLAQLVGMNSKEDGDIQIKPKAFQIGGKGVFVLNFITSCPVNQENKIIDLRRILILRVKDTKLHFHFPIQVMFYPGSGKAQTSVE